MTSDRSPTRLPSYGIYALLALLAALPFAFVSLPPLLDAPGHLGQYAVQAAPPGSPLRAFFQFHWGLRLNLACDLAVEALRRIMPLHRAFWLVCASIPVVTVLGIGAMSRAVNGGRASLTPYALTFAYSYPFLYGFLNFTLTAALSLLSLSLWCILSERPRIREALFWPLLPALMVAHAIGGGLLPVMIAARSLALVFPTRASLRCPDRYRWLLREVRPLLSTTPLILWQMLQPGGGGDTYYDIHEKLNAFALALRDQNRWLDIGSIVLIALVAIYGVLRGARYSRPNLAIVTVLALVFILTPSELTGASFTDMRLAPVLLIALLTLQDWSKVSAREARIVAMLGFALFVTRLMVTTASFRDYERSYRSELAALNYLPRGSKVLALVGRACKASVAWRMTRLDHLPAMVTVDRDSWVNAHWDLGAIHLLEVKFRPSDAFYDDPSQYVWPASCLVDQEPPRTAEEWRNRRRTIEDVMPDLPLGRVDYLWVIDAAVPAGAWTRQLDPIWRKSNSILYKINPGVQRPPSA